MKYLPLLISLLVACGPAEKAEVPPRPNVLLILSDDQGWSDYGFMGHTQIETPHLDRLAGESLTFTYGYVTAPLCRPSLASMATGLYPHQHGVTGNDPAFTPVAGVKPYRSGWYEQRKPLQDRISARFYQHPTLPERLTEAGYLTLQTGKWWENSWQEGGFTHGMTHGDPVRGGRHGDEGLGIGREGLQPIFDLIDTAQANGQPFFIWYAPFLPHAPHTPPQELEEKYLAIAPTPAVARYWAMCEWFDQTVGDLLTKLEADGLSENTLVAYVCDNGWIQRPDKPNRYAPRSKRSPYEMGIRTPMMYRWPGKIEPARDSLHLASSLDLMPTILSACGLAVPEGLPGIDVRDEKAIKTREAVFSATYAHDIADLSKPTRSLQHRIALQLPWKLILPDARTLPEAQPELYHLLDDPGETNNLATQHQEQVQALQATLDDWWKPAE